MSQGATLKMKRRLNFVVIVAFVLAFCILIGSLVNISIFNYDFYSAYAENQQLRSETIAANRGSIYDRNMSILAQSTTAWDVTISPKDIKKGISDDRELQEKQDKIAKDLSEILSVEYDDVFEKMQKNNQYQVISKKVDKEIAEKVRTLITENNWTGEINLVETTKRYYPNNSLASSVIGFTGSDSQGLFGLELEYDDMLSGTPGYTVTLKNALSENIPLSYENKYDPIDGNSLVLTIDENIQNYLEKALNQVMVQHNPAKGCAGIVMNVNTGEIYGMADLPNYDLNNPYTIYDEATRAAVEAIEDEEERTTARTEAINAQRFNKCISYDYEPGSTFKTLVTSAAIEEKTTTNSSSFYCPGYVKVEDRTMKCHVGIPGHGHENFNDALVNSCNPAFVQIGANLGAKLFFKYFKAYGLTEKTGIDLPGELKGSYYTEEQLDKSKVSLASCSFGQSTTVTAIQMATAVSAAVNGGYLVQPHVVKSILDSDGNVVESFDTEVKRQVVSEETSEKLRAMMESVVTTKPGSNAYIQGYDIGGKSGTSQKQKVGDSEDARISSYVAVAPIDDPEILVYIMVDEPQSGDVYGSVVAAPVATSVLADVLPYLGFSPSYTEEELKKQNVSVPYLLSSGVLEAESKLSSIGLSKPKIIGNGKDVVKQVPSAGSTIAKDGKVILYTDDTQEETRVVPNLVGMRTSLAKQKLINLGFNVIVEGSDTESQYSKVSRQSVEEGEVLSVGNVITIHAVNSETD